MSWLVYDKEVFGISNSPLLIGHKFWSTVSDAKLSEHRKSTAIIGFALLGSFLKGVEYVYKRYVTVDLTPSNFFSVGIRMFISAFVALVFSLLIDLDDSNLILGIAFLIGLFPERGFRALLNKIDILKHPEDNFMVSHPLEVIDGIHDLHKIRLHEVGIDNVQNLANYNFLILMVKTPFPVRTILDWVGQAQLVCKFHENYEELRKLGIRTTLDFMDPIKFKQDRISELSTITGIHELQLKINFESFKKDELVLLLLYFKKHLETSFINISEDKKEKIPVAMH